MSKLLKTWNYNCSHKYVFKLLPLSEWQKIDNVTFWLISIGQWIHVVVTVLTNKLIALDAATLRNTVAQDIATWLNVPPAGLLVFGEAYRPCKLTTVVRGYNMPKVRDDCIYSSRHALSILVKCDAVKVLACACLACVFAKFYTRMPAFNHVSLVSWEMHYI